MSLLPCDESGYAIPAADILHDFLVEHPDDPEWGDPLDWPAWTDDLVVGIGPAFFREESFDDPDPLPLTDQADLILLRKLNTTPWQNFLSTRAELES